MPSSYSSRYRTGTSLQLRLLPTVFSNTNDTHDIPPHEPPLHASSYPLPWIRKWPTASTVNFNMTTFLVSLLLQRIKGAFHSTKLIPKGRKKKSLQKIRKLLNLRQDKPSDWKLRNKKNSGWISNGKEVLGKNFQKNLDIFRKTVVFSGNSVKCCSIRY